MTLATLFAQYGVRTNDVADALGVSPFLFDRIDARRQGLPEELAQQIAMVLGCDVAEVRSAVYAVVAARSWPRSAVPLPCRPDIGEPLPHVLLHPIPPVPLHTRPVPKLLWLTLIKAAGEAPRLNQFLASIDTVNRTLASLRDVSMLVLGFEPLWALGFDGSKVWMTSNGSATCRIAYTLGNNPLDAITATSDAAFGIVQTGMAGAEYGDFASGLWKTSLTELQRINPFGSSVWASAPITLNGDPALPVTCTVVGGKVYTIAEASPTGVAATFENLVNVTVVLQTITKTSGGSGFNASCSSVERGTWVQFQTNEATTDKLAGFSTTYGALWSDIEFAFYLSSTGVASIYESGVPITAIGAYTANDVFRIQINSGVVEYLINGLVVYTSAATPPAVDGVFVCNLFQETTTITKVAVGGETQFVRVDPTTALQDAVATGHNLERQWASFVPPSTQVAATVDALWIQEPGDPTVGPSAIIKCDVATMVTSRIPTVGVSIGMWAGGADSDDDGNLWFTGYDSLPMKMRLGGGGYGSGTPIISQVQPDGTVLARFDDTSILGLVHVGPLVAERTGGAVWAACHVWNYGTAALEVLVLRIDVATLTVTDSIYVLTDTADEYLAVDMALGW